MSIGRDLVGPVVHGVPCFVGAFQRIVVEPCQVCGCVCVGYHRRQVGRCWRHEAGKPEQPRLGL